MKIFKKCFFFIFSIFLISNYVFAGLDEDKKINYAIEVLKDIQEIPEAGIPPNLLKNSYGIIIIPGLVKVGFYVGATYGQGILMIKNNNIWSNPCFVKMTGGSFGLQIGAQSTDIILVFKSQKSIDAITKGKITLGADAAVAAGPVGRMVGAGTDIKLQSEIFSYSRSRGLFAGIALEGSAIQIDDNANINFYKKEVSAKDILYKNIVSNPVIVNSLKNQLQKCINIK